MEDRQQQNQRKKYQSSAWSHWQLRRRGVGEKRERLFSWAYLQVEKFGKRPASTAKRGRGARRLILKMFPVTQVTECPCHKKSSEAQRSANRSKESFRGDCFLPWPPPVRASTERLPHSFVTREPTPFLPLNES